jgi:hypothetical protein
MYLVTVDRVPTPLVIKTAQSIKPVKYGLLLPDRDVNSKYRPRRANYGAAFVLSCMTKGFAFELHQQCFARGLCKAEAVRLQRNEGFTSNRYRK